MSAPSLRRIEQHLLALSDNACDGTAIDPTDVLTEARRIGAFAEQIETGLVELPAGGWRGISHAPDDGTEVIVWVVCETTGQEWATSAGCDSRGRWISTDDGLVTPKFFMEFDDLPSPTTTPTTLLVGEPYDSLTTMVS